MPMSSDDPRNSNASTASWIISDTFAPIMWHPSNSSVSASAMNLMKPLVSPDVRARVGGEGKLPDLVLPPALLHLVLRQSDRRDLRPRVHHRRHRLVVHVHVV